MWGIMCYTSGGVTGTRSAWLKEDGIEMEKESFDEADEIATRLTKSASILSSKQTMSPRATITYEATER